MTTKARFLLRAIYALCGAVHAMLASLGRRSPQNYADRDRGLARVNAILADLSALTTRIHPSRVGPAAFAPLRPRPATPPDPQPQTRQPRPAPRPHRPARPLSARRLALRLETLLRDLDQAAAKLGRALPARFAQLAARIRTLAGCQAPEPTPEPTPQPARSTRTWNDLIAEDWDPFTPRTAKPARL